MSHITKGQLDHLAKLCRIQLTDTDKETLLPQLEQIITFVGQLDEVDLSAYTTTKELSDEVKTVCREGVVDAGLADKLLANVQHPIKNNAIEITGTLSEHN